MRGGKEEKVINIIREIDTNAEASLEEFIRLEEFKEFLEKVLQD